MRRFVLSAVLLFAAQASSAFARDANRPLLRVMPEDPNGVYKAAQEVRFLITLPKDGAPKEGTGVDCVIKDDCGAVVWKGRVAAQGGEPLVARAKLDRPGVLRCKVTLRFDANTVLSAEAGAAVDPFQIKAGMAPPDDFDAFWAAQKKKLAAVEMKPEMTPIEFPTKGVECFDVQVPCVGDKPTSGRYARPAGAKPKSLPAVLYVQGAGFYSAWIGTPASAAATGMIAMEINAHGIPNGKPKSYYQELGKAELAEYRIRGIESRETWYFLGMYLRLARALDFLAAQPEWDGKVLMVVGSSQGGSQAIAAAGLDPRVTAIVANVPGHCDLAPGLPGRVPGWPVGVALSAQKRRDEKIVASVRYYDSANFAARTKADVLLIVGLIDDTCPPAGVLAAYNNFAGNKEIMIRPGMGHATPPGYEQIVRKFLAERRGTRDRGPGNGEVHTRP